MSTSSALPFEIEVQPLAGDGICYRLPPRNLGPMRWLAGFPILGGVITATFTGFWVFGIVSGFAKEFGPLGWIAGLVGIPGFIAALGLFAIGWMIGWGRTELRYQDGVLRVIDTAGPFFRRRRTAVDVIDRFTLACAADIAGTDKTQAGGEYIEHLSLLTAQRTTGSPFWLAWGYPRVWLLALAEDLSRNMRLSSGDVQAAPVPVIAETPKFQSLNTRGNVRRWEQPEGSTIELQQLRDGLTFVIPCRGVWQGSHGLFVFSLFWCGFMTVFTSMVGVFTWFGDEKQPGPEPLWVWAAFIVGFWAIGISLMIAAINMGRQQAAIALTAGTLKAIRSNLFGVKRQEWQVDDLDDIRVGPSGMAVNDVPILQLQIVPKPGLGRTTGLLSERDDAELEWIATHLRQAIPTLASHNTPDAPSIDYDEEDDDDDEDQNP